MDVDFRSLSRQDLRLSVWEDGLMWARWSKAGSRKVGGWEVAFALWLAAGQTAPHRVVEAMLASLNVTCRDDAMTIWVAFVPRPDPSVG
ncbi:MAG: hypothetical protein AAF899_15385 [Pseudomonadota bacterium]